MTPVNPVENALARAGEHPRFLASAEIDPIAVRLASNLAAIEAELDAPRPGRLARLLARFGVDERTIPLVTATPALRLSWLGSVFVAVLFALTAAANSTATEGADQIVAFLTLAPLVPLLGVALAFGPAVDPTHEVAVAAPIDGFRLFLVRAITVVGASTAILLAASALVPDGGPYRIAWLLPALAATGTTMALATRFDPRAAAAGVATTWLLVVLIVTQAADPSAAFGPVAQVFSFALTALAAVVFFRRRRRLDTLSIR